MGNLGKTSQWLQSMNHVPRAVPGISSHAEAWEGHWGWFLGKADYFCEGQLNLGGQLE